jgi:hypothetical protein
MLEGFTVPSAVSFIHLYSPRVDSCTLTSITQEGKLERSRARNSNNFGYFAFHPSIREFGTYIVIANNFEKL